MSEFGAEKSLLQSHARTQVGHTLKSPELPKGFLQNTFKNQELGVWKGEFLGQQEAGAWKGLGLPSGDHQPAALCLPRRCPPHGGSNPDPRREAAEWVGASRAGRAAHPGGVWGAAAAGQGERTCKEVAQCYWGTLRHSCLPPCSWPVLPPPPPPSPLPCPLRPSSGDC